MPLHLSFFYIACNNKRRGGLIWLMVQADTVQDLPLSLFYLSCLLLWEHPLSVVALGATEDGINLKLILNYEMR